MFKGYTLGRLATVLGVAPVGAVETPVLRLTTDSRAVQPGDVFVALKGERFDAHQFLPAVAKLGAIAAVVEQLDPSLELPQLQVANSRQALAKLAQDNRQQFQGLTAAVTGSSGKTTVKELLASILRAAFGADAVLATRGNLNNELGVPFTLLELNQTHRAAVIELGASHLGEINYTVQLAAPSVAIITNAGNAHIGEFGGVDKIVQAKGEIIDGSAAVQQVVLNLDDAAYATWRQRAGLRQVMSFSLQDATADWYAADIVLDPSQGSRFQLCYQGQSLGEIQLQLLGRHNIANALAAAAAAKALGIEQASIVAGLQNIRAVAGRMQRHQLGEITLIDDSYNANPVSMCAAIDLLSQALGKRILVLGDMGELGEWSQKGHAEVGRYASGRVDALYAVGQEIKAAVDAYQGPNAYFFASQAELLAQLLPQLSGEQTILVKGSRSAAMDHVVQACLANVQEIH